MEIHVSEAPRYPKERYRLRTTLFLCAIEASACRVLLAAASSWNDADACSSPANQKHCFCFSCKTTVENKPLFNSFELIIMLVILASELS